MALMPKTEKVLSQALRDGLKAREVIETQLYDWEGLPRPSVVAQLTTTRLRQTKGCGPSVINDVRRFLKSVNMYLKDEQPPGDHHDQEAISQAAQSQTSPA